MGLVADVGLDVGFANGVDLTTDLGSASASPELEGDLIAGWDNVADNVDMGADLGSVSGNISGITAFIRFDTPLT